MTERRPTSRPGRLALACVAFALLGALAMGYFNAFELTTHSKYHRDLTQSPHWVAYHHDAFPADDLLRRYASYNESPVQNAIYWLGTWFVDLVPLNKLVGISIFAATTALFYLLVTWMSDARVGALAALFFVVFPRSTYEIAGGFSKAWAIGFVLLSVYVVEQRSWRLLWWAMPLAALAYPVSPVLMGAVVAVGLVLEYPQSSRDALTGLRYLVVGSALALVPLLYKYFTPPEFIGDMVPRSRMEHMWETGMSSERPVPLWEEIFSYLEHPFFVLGLIVLLILGARRGLVWKRSWTALVIASGVAYVVAERVVPRLYLPDRYTRYSIAVLLVLWFAYNWDRVLGVVQRRWVRVAATGILVIAAAASFPESFRACDGDKDQGVWEDRGKLAGVSRAVANLPQPVLVAGHPTTTACVMLQAGRPVLLINRMFHHWFDEYRAQIDERNRDLIRAMYAYDPRDVNRLVEKYGVTHLIVEPAKFSRRTRERGTFYRTEYEELVRSLDRGRRGLVLDPPPPDHVIYTDRRYLLVRLPLDEP